MRMSTDLNALMQISNLEVWFQWPKDIFLKFLSGDLDLGVVVLETFRECRQVSDEVIWYVDFMVSLLLSLNSNVN